MAYVAKTEISFFDARSTKSPTTNSRCDNDDEFSSEAHRRCAGEGNLFGGSDNAGSSLGDGSLGKAYLAPTVTCCKKNLYETLKSHVHRLTGGRDPPLRLLREAGQNGQVWPHDIVYMGHSNRAATAANYNDDCTCGGGVLLVQ